jgi:hypothetical protein
MAHGPAPFRVSYCAARTSLREWLGEPRDVRRGGLTVGPPPRGYEQSTISWFTVSQAVACCVCYAGKASSIWER